MKNKSQTFAKLLALGLIATMGLRDTGVFVRDFKNDKENYGSGEKIEIVKETETVYLVKGKNGDIEVPKDNMIKESKSEFTYEVKDATEIKDRLDNSSLRKLREGEVIEAVYLNGSNGVFKTRDGITGTVDLRSLEEIKEEAITNATAKVDKVLNNGRTSFTIKRGHTVKLKGYENNKYRVIDMEGNEYLADEEDIAVGNVDIKPTRGLTTNGGSANKKDKLVAAAHKELGKPYVSGDTGRRGYDCSGLTYALYLKNFGIKLPRTSGGQAAAGRPVKKSELEPGDLVFFRTGGRSIGHVGVYIGNNNMIHASTGQRRMIVASINSNYFAKRYVTARRILD